MSYESSRKPVPPLSVEAIDEHWSAIGSHGTETQRQHRLHINFIGDQRRLNRSLERATSSLQSYERTKAERFHWLRYGNYRVCETTNSLNCGTWDVTRYMIEPRVGFVKSVLLAVARTLLVLVAKDTISWYGNAIVPRKQGLNSSRLTPRLRSMAGLLASTGFFPRNNLTPAERDV